MASGLTTALVKLGLDFLSLKCQIIALDTASYFYFDKSKRVGFLIDKLNNRDNIDLILNKNSFRFDEFLLPNSIDVCLIDGNHAHPWATLDTINLLPYLKKPSIIIYHDINLYKDEKWREQTGPKYIFDQITGEKKIAKTQRKNVGSVFIDKEPEAYIEALVDALYLPWTCKPLRKATNLKDVISKYYRNDPAFLDHIGTVFDRNNSD